jgi:hypothetical protein
MNPNLVPQAINVVIGDNLYQLKFRVELNPNSSSPQPMDMDNQHEDDGEDTREDAVEGNGNNQQRGHKTSAGEQTGKSSGHTASASKGVSKALQTFHITLPMVEGGGKVVMTGGGGGCSCGS